MTFITMESGDVMEKEVKCRCCKKDIIKSQAYKVGNQSYYCNEECYNNKQSQQIKKNTSNKIKYKPQEGTDRREFTDYLQKIFIENGWDKNKINWKLLMSQSKNILDENKNWSYYTLQYVLYYMYEVLELKLLTKESNYSPLSLLPYYALEAEEYYKETEELDEFINNFDFTEIKRIIPKSENKRKLYLPLDFDD